MNRMNKQDLLNAIEETRKHIRRGGQAGDGNGLPAQNGRWEVLYFQHPGSKEKRLIRRRWDGRFSLVDPRTPDEALQVERKTRTLKRVLDRQGFTYRGFR